MNNYRYEKMTFNEINNTLEKCQICILAVSQDNIPYQVPMYFEYDASHNEPRFILESKDTGQKMRYINNNDKVCVYIQFNESSAYKSIIATGKAYICENDEYCEYKNIIKIKVRVKDITGRAFYI